MPAPEEEMSRATGDSVLGRETLAGSSSLLLLRRRQQQQQWRGRGLVAGEEGGEEGLDLLFSWDSQSVPVAVGGESEGQSGEVAPNLGTISVGSAKTVRGGLDDLLSAADMGKHDYDWLLTPPGSPLSSLDTMESHLSSVPPASSSNLSARSVSATRTSRLSMARLENNHSTRPARNGSVTRPSICNIYSSSNISGNSNRTSVLNTSTISVTSSRPSTSCNRLTTVSSTRQSASTLARPTSRSSTPSKSRPTPSSSGHGSRPSSPTSRSHTSASITRSSSRPSTPTRRAPGQTSAPAATLNSTSTVARSSSRPSTPTRRAPGQSLAPVATLNSTSSSAVGRSSSRPSTPTRRAPVQASTLLTTQSHSVGRKLVTSGRNSAPASRHGSPGPRVRAPSQPPVLPDFPPDSPGPRVRAPSQPPVLPDFPLDVPPNLRTKIPERPSSAGRTRPGLPLTVRANLNSETVPTMNSNGRRPSSPIAMRGRLLDNSPKRRSQSNGHETGPPEIQKPILQENVVRKPVKMATTMESTGFGRTISKMSLDMALRHMDIRQGMGGIRGASLFPQSIRSTASKTRPARMSDPVIPVSNNGTDTDDNNCNGMISTSCSSATSENGDAEFKSLEKAIFVGRAGDPDIYESSRYDAILLKEDSRNLNWLHGIEDKSDQSPVFDHSFEPLPEPFVLL